MPSLWEGLRACCYFLPWIISSCTVSFVTMEDLYRKAGDLELKSQQQKTSLLFCLVPEQRATVYGGLSISHPLCRLCPYFSCCTLTSALGSVGSIFQMKKQKKRSYSLRVLVDFSFLPPPQGAAVGLDPPMEAHLPFHQGCFIPENGPSHHGHLPLLRGRDRGVMGVTP